VGAGSGVIAYMTEFFAFDVEWNAFAFHTDENCGHHIGKIVRREHDGNHIGDPHVHTVNGVAYDFQSVGDSRFCVTAIGWRSRPARRLSRRRIQSRTATAS